MAAAPGSSLSSCRRRRCAPIRARPARRQPAALAQRDEHQQSRRSQHVVRAQAERIARCRFAFRVAAGSHIGLVNQHVLDTAMFVPAGDAARHASLAEVARLSEVFFDQLRRHTVPVEEVAIRRISNNSVALDLHAWLACCLHALAKSTPVPGAALKAQFGADCARMDNFRPTFLKNLGLTQAVYRHATVEVTERGPLPPASHRPVPPRPVSLVAGRPPSRPAVLPELPVPVHGAPATWRQQLGMAERAGGQEGRHEGN
ncbi:replication protein RepA [Paracraurococcus sp. LOR1-02]|uniref:Replication protein RepA n=2 Tax=Paracraurococcus lichenis TaxID=3064888 RepID=A0ABT9EAM0_9PROT|nr:replication protein RepA [Paracraurococcus sp. LOR1-02]MDO9713245.1 replication protein RepA [Paracraurococcus sp. LOR1-02]